MAFLLSSKDKKNQVWLNFFKISYMIIFKLEDSFKWSFSLLCSPFSSSTHRPTAVYLVNAKCKCELCKHTNFDAQVSLVDWERTKGWSDEPGRIVCAYLWFQWVVTNGAAAIVFTDNTKVVSTSWGQHMQLWCRWCTHTRGRRCLFFFSGQKLWVLSNNK